MTKENDKTVFELEGKLKDFLDVVCENENERQVYSLQIAWDMILCSCPYDKEKDITMVSNELLQNRVELLKKHAKEYYIKEKNKQRKEK